MEERESHDSRWVAWVAVMLGALSYLHAIVGIGRTFLTVLKPRDGQGRRDVWRSVENSVKGGNGVATKASNAPREVHGEGTR